MQLKKLEIFGFKSFSDKTSFEFERGITVIVGPNGCGKSNVVDAIKWILGDQSAKSLRGNEMSDVIFSGTNKRPSMGYAEASLTILNDKNMLPIEYEEVCIARRLYTSGESEYLINKQTCRLRDIKELFMDTGVGANCYSLIEQGKVDTLLQANIQERRFVFEEAAGISKYKTKKREAMLKLEKVEQNLLRLSDIIEEVQKQLRSVKLQAAKARKYNEYINRLKDLRLKLSLKRYRSFKTERANILKQIHQKENQGQEMLTNIEDLQVKKDSLHNYTDELVSGLGKSQSDLANLDAKITSTHDRISFNHKAIEELNNHKDKYERYISVFKDRINEAENGIASLARNLEEIQNHISENANRLSKKESELKQYSFECDILHQKIEENKKRVIDILHRESNLQNEMGSLSAERDTIANRKAKLSKRQEDILSELERIDCARQGLTKQRDIMLSNIENLEACLSGINERLVVSNNEIKAIDDNINSQQQLLSRKESRLEILEDLERRYEGIGSGVKFILEEARKNDGLTTNICGMVADLISVDATYVPAIEAALGDRAQIIVTNSLKEVIQAINYLKKCDKGYVKFLPLNDIKARNTETSFDLNIPGVIGKVVDLVKSKNGFNSLVEYIFGGTIIVKDFNTALTLANDKNGVNCFVTLNGEVIEPGGTILVGVDNVQIGLISRKTELENIKLELQKIEKEIAIYVNEKRIKTKEIEDLFKESDEIRKKIDAGNILRVSNENNLQKEEFKIVELNEEKDVNESEINEISELIEKISQREATLNDEVIKLSDQRKNLESQVAASTEEKMQKEATKINVQNEITELKVFIAQKEERKDNINTSTENLKGEYQKNKEELASTNNEINNCQEKTIESEREIINLNKSYEEFKKEKPVLEKDIVTLKEKQSDYNEQLNDINIQTDEYREGYSNHEQKINDLRLKENEFKVKIMSLEERNRDDYHVELSELDLENKEEYNESFDWESVSQEIEQLKGKTERMGNVNLEAIQEQKELETRDVHLEGQMEDLQKSKNTLRDIIEKINITSRELFEKTFHDIRNNFHEIFRKLFGGGRADIILEEGVDILDAGIEIIAQPPGKDLRSITLFSGGEKVMTTIALLFAVFQSKPSPFCILDEVDAALDENNINHFIHILKEFTKTSQFLIITHNKQTMSIADVLYGITMEEAGVSKKVSVKFKNAVREVA
ncbi:MAG TPA: chromosome segregation protein SMC [Candidatus Scalindua sp.]|nr:chromosome segregation protein SMC [Candidatus Scalindua sp.]